MLILIDNYDSFTYNLVQLIGTVKPDLPIKIFRNDMVDVETIEQLCPTFIVISPGPCTPHEAGASCEIVRHFAPRVAMLGVCLGHQCIAQAFGAQVVRSETPVHGKPDLIYHDGKGIYSGVENPFVAARYHSLVVQQASLPETFQITARTQGGEIMGFRHKTFNINGLQFHPESFMTPVGEQLMGNFLTICG